jgi:hypothetical protein
LSVFDETVTYGAIFMKRLLLSGTALLLSAAAALAGGAFSQYPIVGNPDQTTCMSFGNNGVCNQYAPAGPSETSGTYMVPADTGTPGGGTQTIRLPMSLIANLNVGVNRLFGGDMGTNLWQRGTTPLSSATPSTTTMGADRWAVYSSGNTVTVSKQTGASDTMPTVGFYASQRVSRPSGTNNTQICVGQVLDKQAAATLIGNNGVFSFYALAGAGLAAVANNQITATIAYYTAADSATPGTNTDTFMKGTITGYTPVTTNGGVIQVIGNAVPNAVNSVTISSGVATVPITTSWTRYSVWGKIPSTNAAGTAVTGAGVTLCYTPASGTGGATEWFEFTGAQLQATSSVVTTELPFGVTSPTGYERRHPQSEADLQLYYTQGPGAEVNGQYLNYNATCTASGNVNIGINFSTPMRIAPTQATSTLTAGGYSIKTAAAVTGIGTMTIPVASTYGLTLNSNAACTTTLPYIIVGTNTTGSILFSAEP